MTTTLSQARLAQLQQFVAAQMGLHFAEERFEDLERGLGAAATEFGYADAESCAAWLLTAPLTRAQIEVLASHLTIGETYFFRDPECFAALEREVLPALIRARAGRQKRLRIWSAACCSGEEAYSLAIVLTRVLPDWAEWELTLLATDINPRALHKAAAGVFGEWSFRGAAPGFRERYFRPREERMWEILPELRRMVTFSYLNLAKDTYPSLATNTNGMDLILCRNALMYFEPARFQRVAGNLFRSLAAGGWLLVAASEVSQANFPGFEAVPFPGAIFYRKPAEVAAVMTPAAPREALAAEVVSVAATPRAPEVVAGPERDRFAEAQARFADGRYAEAGAALAALAAAGPLETRALALWAHVCANEGRLAEARRWCEEALAREKLNASLHYLRASVLQEQGELLAAAASFQRALFLEPNFVLAHFALGNLARRLGRLPEARKNFTNARQLLHGLPPGEVLPESDGLTAGRLAEVIESLLQQEQVA